MPNYRLSDDERDELAVGVGMPRGEVFAGGDWVRRWRITWDEGGVTWMRHAEGAMLRLAWADGAVADLQVLEGQPAVDAEVAWAYRTPAAVRARLAGIAAGEDWEAALVRQFGPRHLGVVNLDVRARGAGQTRRYRSGGVIAVDLDAAGRVVSLALADGPTAVAAVKDATVEAVDLPGGVHAVRTWGELWLATWSLAGAPVSARIDAGFDPPRVRVVAEMDEGRRGLWFTVADRARLDPAWLGEGPSVLLDGVDLVLAASAAESRGDRAVAAAAVRAAIAAIPAGVDRLPPDGLRSRVAARVLGAQPDRFTRASLTALAARLGAA